MGDYFDMVSDAAGFRLAWAGTFNGEQDVYFGRKVISTGVGQSPLAALPGTLLQVRPNPFRVDTTVRYEVPRDAFVTLKVYDALGREVATLVSGRHPAGSYEARLDGRSLASGVYFYRLDAGGVLETRKALHLK
jgi:hypothetical protein